MTQAKRAKNGLAILRAKDAVKRAQAAGDVERMREASEVLGRLADLARQFPAPAAPVARKVRRRFARAEHIPTVEL